MKRIIASAFALALIASPASAQTEARIGKNTTITVGWLGCKSEAVFNKLISIAGSGDTTAFLKFSFDNKATGECMVLPAGLKVRIENISQQHMCVRPEGREAIAQLKRQEAETAERVAEVEAETVWRHEEAVERKDNCFWIEIDHAQ